MKENLVTEAKIKILLVDDHLLVRESFSNLLQLNAEFEVVGEAGNGEEALEKALQLEPDVVLMDIALPKFSGLEVTKHIKEKLPEVGVIILSMHDEDEYVIDAVKAGASGYLLKSSSDIDELFRAIKVVHSGGFMYKPKLTKKILLQITKEGTAVSPKTDSGFKELSQREIEILQAVSEGKSNKEIAEKLFISEKTVKAHLRSIFRKLDVGDRTQAVAYAMRKGWVE